MAGATSIVQLILKKWGDDITGAAKELKEKVGFPEEVANRIATGELPMDAESVAKRESLFDGVDGYHASTHDIKQFDGYVTGADNDFGQGTYITDDVYDASENYAGEGADLTSRLHRHAESNHFQDFVGEDEVRNIGGRQFTKSQWDELDYDQRQEYLLNDARAEIKGTNDGVIYPVKVNQDGVVSSTDRIRDSVEFKEWDDYLSEAADDLEPSYRSETRESLLDPDGEFYDEVHDHALELQYNDESSPTMVAYDVMRRYGLDEGPFELDQLNTWQDLRDVLDDKVGHGWWPMTDDGEMMNSGAIMNEVMQELGIKGYNDMSSASRFSGMDGGAGNHTIMFPGSENQIRSVNAAFDPQYNGPNIMGGAALPVAAGLLTAGQSDDADAGPALRLAQGVDLDRLVGAWRKAVSREPDIDPSTHLQNIIHDKNFVNYNDWSEFARKQDGGKNGETYFNELKPFLIDISKHPNVAKDNRLRLGLTDYANKRFAIRKAEGHKPDGPRGGQRGSADPYSLLPVAGVGAAAASLAAPHIQDSGMASAPRSEALGDITMGLRGIERRLEGSPAALLFPEGLTDYLETVNRREEDPNAMTRGMALLDVLPF